MAEYKCKEKDCDETVAWHLIHGELECIGDNRAALAEYAVEAEAALTRQEGNLPPQAVIVQVKSPGYKQHNVVVGLEPVGTPSEPGHGMEM